MSNLVYRIGHFNRKTWEGFVDSDLATKLWLSDVRRNLGEFDEFAVEVFSRLFDPTLQRLSPSEIRPEAAWAVELHDQIDRAAQSLTRIRSMVGNDRLRAAKAAVALLRSLVRSMPTPETPIEDLTEKRQVAIALKGMAGNGAESGEVDPTEAGAMLSETQQGGKAVVRSAQALAEQIRQNPLEGVISFAVDEVKRLLEELADLEATLPGSLHSAEGATGGDLQLKQELLKRISRSDKLRQIVRLAGRILPVAKGKQAQKNKALAQRIAGVKTGANLQYVLPTELAALAAPALKPLFFEKYSSRSLLQYEMTGEMPHARGPIVICLDSSGSMRGDREIWSKALAWTVLSIASTQKRDVHLVHWGAWVHQEHTFPATGYDQAALLQNMEYFADAGSTDAQTAISRAAEFIRDNARFKKADIIFITDGGCNWDSPKPFEEWNPWYQEIAEKQEIRIFPVIIGPRYLNEAMTQFINPENSIVLSDALTEEDIDRANSIFDSL